MYRQQQFILYDSPLLIVAVRESFCCGMRWILGKHKVQLYVVVVVVCFGFAFVDCYSFCCFRSRSWFWLTKTKRNQKKLHNILARKKVVQFAILPVPEQTSMHKKYTIQANPNVGEKIGLHTLLELKLSDSNTDLVEMLLDYGANPNAVDNNNRVRALNSLLLNLCKLKNVSVLKLALNHNKNSIDLESTMKN